MQREEQDVLDLLKRFTMVDVPSDLQGRRVCSSRSRIFTKSCVRRRNAFRVAAVCSVANIILGLIALQTHKRHRRLEATLYGG